MSGGALFSWPMPCAAADDEEAARG